MDKATGKAPVITVDSGSSSDSSSNVSATPDHGDTACKLLVLAHETAENKTKMEEEAGEIPGATDAPLLLDLTLVNAGSSLDDLLSSNKVMVIKESSSSDNSARGELPPANRVFICTYCKKEFSSWQALGGHQNAHRLERLMVKRQQEMKRQGPPSTMTYGYGGFNAPYSNVPQFPAFGPLNQLALPGAGMAQPMVRRVQPSWSQPGSRVVQNGPWPGHLPMMASPPPRMDTNFNNNFNNGGLVGQCRFNPPPAFDHLQQGGGAMMHSFRGPSSIPSPNVPMNTVANGGGSSRGGGDSSGNRHVVPGKRDDRPKTDHGEPDLTLKL